MDWRVFSSAFLGKVAAALFIAVCAALAFGPDKWARWMLEGALPFVTPAHARLAFGFLGGVVVLLFLWPYLKSATTRLPWGATAKSDIPIAELRDRAIASGWDADIFANTLGENHFWNFQTRLEQAAANGEIQFWGRKHRVDYPEDLKETEILKKITPDHFEDFKLDVHELAQAKNYDVFTHKPGCTPNQLKGECFRDLHVNADQAKAWLKNEGKTPPGASFNVRLIGAGQIGGYDCPIAIEVKNIQTRKLTNCLVQIEQISCTRPDGMPMPLVLRTEGQIHGDRSGRFMLSPNQPKSVPALFRNPKRKNDWFFIDENKNSYFVPCQAMKIVAGAYGGKSRGKLLIDICIDEDWRLYPTLETVASDFTLSAADDDGNQ